MSSYEPNIENAISVLVDIMVAHSFTLTRQPYEPNYRGLVDALIDLKEGFPTFTPERIGFDATTFEAVASGDALYMQSTDGRVGKAIANDTLDKATVVGFADDAALSGATVRVLVAGMLDHPGGLDVGDIHFLSAATAGAITNTAPSDSLQYVTRVGEASKVDELTIQIEPPIKLM